MDGYRVRKGFSAQAQAESRRYSYYLPMSALRGQPLSELQSILREYHAPVLPTPNARTYYVGKYQSCMVSNGSGCGRSHPELPFCVVFLFSFET